MVKHMHYLFTIIVYNRYFLTMGSNNTENYDEKANLSVLEVEQEEMRNFKNVMEKLYSIWEEFGIEPDQKAQRAKVVFNHVHSLLRDILEEERNFYEDIKARVQNYTIQVTELSKILSVPYKENSCSLIQKEEILRQELDILTKVKCERVETYKELKNEETIYCQMLKLNERLLPYVSGVPSLKDFNELEQQIILLRDEKQRRHIKFCTMKSKLITILETIELEPESLIEKEILSPTENVPLSDETFKLLEEAISKAKAKKQELEALRKDLVDKLSNLWQRVKVKENWRVEFLSKHSGCSLSILKAIEREVVRCDQIKRDNIKTFIKSLKEELAQLWAKCHVSESQKHKFKFYSSPEVTDEVLDAFEIEVEKWRSYHQEVHHIVEKIDKRQDLFDLMIEFENKASNQNRFKNRGGNLLTEEKERKKLQKALPALEDKILHDIEVFENKKGRPFLYHGEEYKTFITRQWEGLKIQKENEKRQRQKQHIYKLQNVSVGTPLKEPLKTTPKSAPNKMFKYNLRTPAVNKSKQVPNAVSKPPSKNSKHNCSRPNAIKLKDQMVIREINKLAKSKLDSASESITTYTQFADELNTSAKSSSRSSVLATKKPGGTRISITSSRMKRKCSQTKSPRTRSKMIPILTPAKEMSDLQCLI